jgi:hypothetical protein
MVAIVDMACSTGRNQEMPEGEFVLFFFQQNIDFAKVLLACLSSPRSVLASCLSLEGKKVVMIFLDGVNQNKQCDLISIFTITLIN